MWNEQGKSFRGYTIVIRLLKRFSTRHDLSIIAVASLAWALRAVAGAVMFPIAIGDIVSYLNSGGSGLPEMAVVLLILFLVINVVSEWAFLPYWYLFARKSSEIRGRLADSIDRLPSIRLVSNGNNVAKSKEKDVVSKIVSDVDFVMGNTFNSIGTIMPNFFTISFAMVTIAYSNPLMAVIASLLLPPYLFILSKYSNKVFTVRMEERRIFSHIIKLSSDAVEGDDDAKTFKDTLKNWNKAVYKLAFFDRVYWFFALLIMGLGPILLLLTGVYLLRQGLFNVGGLVTIILAGTNLYTAVTNMIWGFALLSQAVPPARRIEETLGNISYK